MDLTIILLAFALATDSFSVSISNGVCYNSKLRTNIIASSIFAFFQATMLVAGYFLGGMFFNIIVSVDHWIALILLSYIGYKLISDSIKNRNQEYNCDEKLTLKLLITQSIATSIDALAVGVSLVAISKNIHIDALVVGVVTFLCCIIGHKLGNKVGKLLGNYAQLVGGVVLVFIGIKIFLSA